MNYANRLFAQVTQVPTSGASNAEDFQPPTRNPQGGTTDLQQQTKGLQTPSSQDILTDRSARIIVPNASTAAKTDTPAPQPASSSSTGFVVLTIVFVILVFIVAYLWKNRLKGAKPGAEPLAAGPEPVNQDLAKVDEPEKVEDKPKPKAKSTKAKTHKPQKKKSKSKRKKSRK